MHSGAAGLVTKRFLFYTIESIILFVIGIVTTRQSAKDNYLIP